MIWLVNMDFGGLVPTVFVRSAMVGLMYYPRAKTLEIVQGLSLDPITDGAADANAGEHAGGSKFFSSMPKEYNLEDCLIAKFKGNGTIAEQREYFQREMKAMVETTDGWVFQGKTRALDVADVDQIDVHEREVKWSAVKQMRSVVQTSDYSVEEIFGLLCDHSWRNQKVEVNGRSRTKTKAGVPGRRIKLFSQRRDCGLTFLLYRELLFSWPFSPRHVLIVQDYCRVREDDGSSWFVCYNHDVESEYFTRREGFLRASIKFQGMVGLPRFDGGARLTWIVNCDLSGLVPEFAVRGGLLKTMFYPKRTILELEARWQAATVTFDKGCESRAKREHQL